MLPPIDGSPPNPTTSRPINNEKISEKTVLIIIFGAIGGSLTLFCAGSFIYRQRMSWKAKLESIRANHHKKDEEHVDVTLDYWELTWDRLLVKSDKLGSGAFGQVLRGKIIGKPPCVDHFYVNLQQRNVTQMENADVAIKMLPKYADDAAKKEFMNEIELMKLIGYHENIVNMLGCVTVGHPLCLVLEFCPFRDLHQYVKARKKFLASKSIIHRDLAARNILIDSDRNAKISDFGLCIHASENMGSVRKNTIAVSATGRLPIKWLAIESLKKHEFSLKSDIWSFGIVLYEMYSFGEVPFSKIEPKDLIEHLERGNRPEKPELCTKEIYDVMMKCWNENPEDRPSFEELLTVFTVFLERSTETYGYLPLLKTENAPLANETNCKTNDGVADSKKTRKSDSFNFFGALSRRWSTISGNKNDSRTELNETVVPGPSNPKWMKNYYEDHPDLEIGNRSRFQSFISDSVASTHGSMDPGVEMINGRPRLRNQLSENFASTNSSMRKSLSFNHADRKPDNHDNRRMSFGLKQLFLKKFKQESNHNTPEK
uniref:Protein kinase domain-containing protein n=1 Tax=Panagrolaimus sp. JU765 TaxID=591449 RepID=A0AC34QZU9_9BILA